MLSILEFCYGLFVMVCCVCFSLYSKKRQIMCRQIPHRGKKPMEIANAVLNEDLRPSVPG